MQPQTADQAKDPGVSPRHYEPFLDSHDAVVDAELAFLHRHLVDATSDGERG